MSPMTATSSDTAPTLAPADHALPPAARGLEPGALDLAYCWFLLVRKRWHIVTFVLAATAVVTMLTLMLPKKYKSSALLRVDPQGRSTVGQQAGQSGPEVDPTMLVTTEAQVITSPAVVSQLIEKLNLQQNPEFAPAGYKGGPFTLLQQNQVLQEVTRDVSVGQPIDTLLLQIGFTSHDPNLAAQAANTLSEVYLEHEYSTRAQALSDASKNMVQQMDGLRAQMEKSQSALINYESTHDVIDPDDKNNIYQARLSQINTALGTAEGERIQLAAEYEVARTGDPDSLAATPPGKALQAMEDRLHQDQSKLGQLATIYGPRHPLYVQQQKLVDYDRNLLQENARHIARQVESQYRAALLREQMNQVAVNREKTAMDAFNMRTIRYHSLQAASNSATQLYYNLQQRVQDATVAAGLHSEELRIISPAQPSPIPVAPRPVLYGAATLAGSLFLAIVGVLAVGLMDRTVSTPEQVEQRFHCRALAALPLAKDSVQILLPERYGLGAETTSGTLAHTERRSPFEEAILALHSAIQFAGGEGLRVLAVTSSMPGEGKSTVACHLATAFAATGTRTVLVDGDLRKPNVHRKFQLVNRQGVTSVLRGQKPLAASLVPMGTNLEILTAGVVPSNPAELLHAGLSELIDELRSQFGFVIIDCPPALGFADAAVIANLADGFVLVASAGETEQSLITASLRQMQGVRAQLLGIILNRASAQTGGYYSYFNDYSNYYHGGEEEEEG